MPSGIFDFDFDTFRARMAKGVDQSLAANAKIVAQQPAQRSPLALHNEANPNFPLHAKFLLDS